MRFKTQSMTGISLQGVIGERGARGKHGFQGA